LTDGTHGCASITWQDTRTAAAADAVAAEAGIQRFEQETGLPISTYSSALKLAWLLDQPPRPASTGLP